ncbi:hypothetical protein ABPG72_012181 [Tetrahymena utriculariae]
MTNYFTKTYAKFDIFGSEVGINYQKDNLQNHFWRVMTLGFFAFLGVFFWNNIFSFLNKVISLENDKHDLTRAEIEEQVKQNIKRVSQSNINLMKSLKVNEKQQKLLRINVKLTTVVQKAAMKFKKPFISKLNQQNTISTYNII